MTLERILDIAKAYNDLGWAIQEQLNDVAQGDMDGHNPNALRAVRRFIVKVKEHADVNGDDELMNDVDEVLDNLDTELGLKVGPGHPALSTNRRQR